MSQKETICVVDWGSSRGRASFVSNGRIVDSVEWGEGILHGTMGDKRQYLESQIAEKLEKNEVSIVLALGMAGSRTGIAESPYLSCPVNVTGWVRGAVSAGKIGLANLVVFPGISTMRSPGNLPGVMRGEEAELFSLGGISGTCVAVLPGTHSKWVWLQENEIQNFETYPTGEVFQHWITSRSVASLVQSPSKFSMDGFRWGMNLANQSSDLLATLFSLRSSCLLGKIGSEKLSGAISGALIRSEVRSGLALSDRTQKFILVASGLLADLYAEAFAREEVALEFFAPDHAVLVDSWLNLGPVRNRR